MQGQACRLVAIGSKPGARFTCSRQQLRTTAHEIRSLGLQMVVGFWRTRANQLNDASGFSEWTSLEPSRDSTDMVWVYISKTEKQAELLRRLDSEGRDRELGLLFGYPDCCTKSFSKLARAGDPVLETYGPRATASWPMNVSLFCTGLAVLEHVPCSSDCRASLALANEYLRCLLEMDRQRVTTLHQKLSALVLHTRDSGIAAVQVDGDIFSEAGAIVREITALSSPDCTLGSMIHKGAQLLLDDHNKEDRALLSIDRHSVLLPMLGLFDFSREA